MLNLLSFLRIVVIPFIGFSLFFSKKIKALILCLLAYSTDIFDGYLARKLKKTSVWGRIIDAFIDKIFFVSLLFFLIIFTDFPFLIGILLIFKEILLIILGGLLLLKERKISSPNIFGRMAGFILTLVIIIYILDYSPLKKLSLLLVILTSFFSLFFPVFSCFKKRKREGSY